MVHVVRDDVRNRAARCGPLVVARSWQWYSWVGMVLGKQEMTILSSYCLALPIALTSPALLDTLGGITPHHHNMSYHVTYLAMA